MKIADIYQNLPTLKTARLVLRAISLDDVQDYFAFASDEDLVRHLRWGPHAIPAQTESYIRDVLDEYREGKDGPWGIADKRTGAIIGSIHLFDIDLAHRKAQIGFVLTKAHWNQGIVTEALGAVLEYTFETLRLHRIEGLCTADNAPAQRVMVKASMRQEGLLRACLYQKGAFRDMALYAILERDYRARTI